MKTLSLFFFGFLVSYAGYAQNWISLNSGTTNHLTSICFPDTNTGYAVGSNGTILKTTDGGLNWASQYYYDSYNFNAVRFINPDTGYIAGYLPAMRSTGILLKTTDGGLNWIKQEIDTTQYFGAMQLLGADTIFVIGSQILKSFDGGTSWSVLNTPEGGAFWACSSAINYLACDHQHIYNTTDGGISWLSQIFGGFPGGFWDIRFSNKTNGLAVGGGYAQGFYYNLLFYTTDGNDWNISTYDCDKYHHSVFYTDEITAYVVGTEGSIIKTTDAGIHFAEQSSGTSKHLNDVFFIGSEIGYIAGDNGTILKSSEPVGLPATPSSVEDPVTVYPNPFHDKLSISINRRFNTDNTSVAIFDPLGQMHFEKAIVSYHQDFDLPSLIPGVYFLKISNAENRHVIKLIRY